MDYDDNGGGMVLSKEKRANGDDKMEFVRDCRRE